MYPSKKVFNADIVCALPHGQSCFIWFTLLAFPEPTCILIDLDSFNRPILDSIAVLSCCFKLPLAYGYGTVIKGTRFESSRPYFSIEEPLYYKGDSIERHPWDQKMAVTRTILEQDLDQDIAEKHCVSFILIGLPLIAETVTALMKLIPTAGYKVGQLQYINTKVSHSSKTPFKIKDYKTDHNRLPNRPLVPPTQSIYAPAPQAPQAPQAPPPPAPVPVVHAPVPAPPAPVRTRIFTVCPTETTDIYNLFNIGERDLTNIDRAQVAGVSTYKTSVLMNSIFRNIKENVELDALEESDDEDEFEDESKSKFVIDMNMQINMVCEYNAHFKKWVPIKKA